MARDRLSSRFSSLNSLVNSVNCSMWVASQPQSDQDPQGWVFHGCFFFPTVGVFPDGQTFGCPVAGSLARSDVETYPGGPCGACALQCRCGARRVCGSCWRACWQPTKPLHAIRRQNPRQPPSAARRRERCRCEARGYRGGCVLPAHEALETTAVARQKVQAPCGSLGRAGPTLWEAKVIQPVFLCVRV